MTRGQKASQPPTSQSRESGCSKLLFCLVKKREKVGWQGLENMLCENEITHGFANKYELSQSYFGLRLRVDTVRPRARGLQLQIRTWCEKASIRMFIV